MPFIFRNLTLPPADGMEQLKHEVSKRCAISLSQFSEFKIQRKAVDARHKSSIKIVYTVLFSIFQPEALQCRISEIPGLEWNNELPSPVFNKIYSPEKIVIVGTGPAGLFTALRLAKYGIVATVVERGQPVEQRAKDVNIFWNNGVLNPESNVQFGEGGAGTFSDGKLTCRTKDPAVPWILQQFADFGAEPDITYLAKPHIGTDKLRTVVSNIRRHLIEKGFTIHFGSKVTDISTTEGKIVSVIVNNSKELPSDRLVMATGHSARDTYQMLFNRGIHLDQKPFAIGLRVEHPQHIINEIQYGRKAPANLPVADYAVTWNNTSSGRSAYSFCMCPGGIVIAGSSEPDTVVTNGMSSQKRNSQFANSALVVNIKTTDFGGTHPLAGLKFQKHWENKAFVAGGNNYNAPAQNLMSFLNNSKTKIASTYRPGITEADLKILLPHYVTSTLLEAIPEFGKKMRGFVTAEAMLIGVETRTSAPVRIRRNENLQSDAIKGIYPAGEGAGYAGGIMSAAIDGVRIADLIAQELAAK